MTEPQHWQTSSLDIAAYLSSNNLEPIEVVPAGSRGVFRYASCGRLSELLNQWESRRRVLRAKLTVALDADQLRGETGATR